MASQLRTLPLFPEDAATASEHLSALVKTIRLRMPVAAVAHLATLWRGKTTRARAQRRLLISAAEDNLSVPVMRRVVHWFDGRQRDDLNAAAAEVARLCSTPNWYANEAGREYIRSWRSAERGAHILWGRSECSLHGVMSHAVRDGRAPAAMQAFMALTSLERFDPIPLAALLVRLALERGSDGALQVAELYADHCRTLWRDGNFSGLALYMLCSGEVGPQIDPEVPHAVQLTAQALQLANDGLRVPDWCKDGIHTTGCDPRFSGTLERMAAVCDAFETFGSLSPDEPWTA
jgi:hypothetical protein